MMQSKTPRTIEDSEAIAAYCLKQQPRLEQVEGATINLDEDGRWTVGVKYEATSISLPSTEVAKPWKTACGTSIH